MTETRSVAVATPALAADRLGFFRWGRIAGNILVTTDAGDWAFLSEAEFTQLLAGEVGQGHSRFQEFRTKGFVRDGLDLDAMAERLAARSIHVSSGPNLHIVVLTSRCGSACPCCKGAGNPAADMTADTAEKVVDLALQCPSTALTFEFQGGDPLANFDVLRRCVDSARSRGQRAGKSVTFNVVSNFSAMTEERAEWLIGNDVLVCTHLDGPAAVHDANRAWRHGSAHADVARWMDYFNRRYVELGRDPRLWHVDGLLTTTRRTLDSAREVVDEYVARGLRALHLRPLSPVGLSSDDWAKHGYTAEEYLAFYRRALDYILELNRQGVEIMERRASVFLTKILVPEDAGFLDIQSPCGAGSGELVYNFDGRVFPSDEARLVDAAGDSMFDLGRVTQLSANDLVRHPTVRAIAAASLLDAQPMCAECWNKPFCGFSPVRNYVTQGDLFGQRPRSAECKEHMAISGRMFELLENAADSETAAILKRWTVSRPRLGKDGRAIQDASEGAPAAG